MAEEVAKGNYDLGIIMCGTGIGIGLAANKVPGVRAAMVSEPYSAAFSRRHNNTNVLSMGSRVVGVELAKMIVKSWLDAKFEGGRHQRRIDELSAEDERNDEKFKLIVNSKEKKYQDNI